MARAMVGFSHGLNVSVNEASGAFLVLHETKKFSRTDISLVRQGS